MKDVMQIWVADGCVLSPYWLWESYFQQKQYDRKYWTPEMIRDLDDARDRILGPQKERDRRRPPPGKGKKLGGTAYERSPRAKSVKEPARSYTFGPSIESPTSITAPVASAKAKDGQMPADVDDRSFLLKVSRFSASPT